MKSPNLVKTFGTASDVYVTDVQEVMEYMSGHTKEDMEARLDELVEILEKMECHPRSVLSFSISIS